MIGECNGFLSKTNDQEYYAGMLLFMFRKPGMRSTESGSLAIVLKLRMFTVRGVLKTFCEFLREVAMI